jgi:hemerythrin-like metal-binding protein
MSNTQFKWKDEYAIGHQTIDSQHKGLLELGTLLEELIKKESELSDETFLIKLEEVCCDLIYYTEYHFRTEEDIMREYNFSEFQAHQKVHKKLVEKVSSVRKEILSGSILSAKQQLNFLLSSWLTDHIIQHDLQLKDLFGNSEMSL